jgi:hypothetical protein
MRPGGPMRGALGGTHPRHSQTPGFGTQAVAHVHCRTQHLGMWQTNRRMPRLLLRLSGWLPLRMAARQFCAGLFQEPPRTAAGAPRSRSCMGSIARCSFNGATNGSQKIGPRIHFAMLPFAAQAIVEPSKVRDYLLSSSHPVGRFKAVVFDSLGYTAERWEKLAADLTQLARTQPAIEGQASFYGKKYEVSGKLVGPNGRTATFTTVWMIKPDRP